MLNPDNRVWDYHGDYFVHRLIQNDNSRKIVETKAGSSSSTFMGGAGDEKNKAEIEMNIQMECMG